jgi:hypothetical protein
MATSDMSSATLYTGLTEAHYAAIIHEVVEEALWANNVCKKFCRHEDISDRASRSLQINYWDANTAAAALTETEDLTNTALTLSSVTITTAEVGAMTTLSDWLLETSVGALREITSYGKQLGKSIAKKIDQDLTALFSALNGGVAAGTGSGDTDIIDAIASAQYILDGNDADGQGDVRPVVLHSQQVNQLREQLLNTKLIMFEDWKSKPGIAQDANGFVGTFLHNSIWQTNNVAELTVAKRGAMITDQETFAYISKRSNRPFTQRDESLRATEIGSTLAYAVGETRDKNGVCISTSGE